MHMSVEGKKLKPRLKFPIFFQLCLHNTDIATSIHKMNWADAHNVLNRTSCEVVNVIDDLELSHTI